MNDKGRYHSLMDNFKLAKILFHVHVRAGQSQSD